jgi:hypothetical protein
LRRPLRDAERLDATSVSGGSWRNASWDVPEILRACSDAGEADGRVEQVESPAGERVSESVA